MSLIDRIELWLKLTERSREYSANSLRQALPYIVIGIIATFIISYAFIAIINAAKRWDDKRKQRKRNENAPDL